MRYDLRDSLAMRQWPRLLVLATSAALAACSNLTETAQTFISPDKFYQTDAQAAIAVNAIYQPLMSWNGWKQPAQHSIMCDEDEDACESWMGGGRGGNIAGQWFADGNAVWQGDYTIINRANQVLNYISGSGSVSASAKAAALGSAKFARAYAYFDLVRRYGAVPMRLEMYQPEATLGARARTPVDSIWHQITQDLQAAGASLPTGFNASNGSGQPRAASAYGLLAKVYLHMAGAEVKGTSLEANRARYLDSAVIAAQKVMADGSTGLAAKYMDNFTVGTQNGVKEILFAIQGNRGDGSNVTAFFSPAGDCSLVGGCGPAGPGFVKLRPDFVWSFDKTDLRWQKNVTWPITWLSMPASQSQYKGVTNPVIHNDSFSVLETKGLARKDSVLAYDGWQEGCEWNRLDPGFYMVHMKNAAGDWVGDTVAIPTYTYYTLKWTDKGNTGSEYGNGNNFPILRYADVLLVLAEAENERNAASSLAYQAINLVRTRAGLPNLTAGLTQAQFRDSVWVERKHELYAEFQRRFDMLREGTYLTIMNKPVNLPYAQNTVCRPRQAFQVLQPIPTGELAANPLLKQNPGY